jgi:hypothetical protein
MCASLAGTESRNDVPFLATTKHHRSKEARHMMVGESGGHCQSTTTYPTAKEISSKNLSL